MKKRKNTGKKNARVFLDISENIKPDKTESTEMMKEEIDNQ
jgi:hypothetical protein